MIKRIAAAAFAVLMLAACGKSEFRMDAAPVFAEVTAKNAAADATASGAITVSEGECVVISSNIKKGEVNIMFKDHTGNIELNESYDGNGFSSTPITPGEYDVTATVTKKATGTITILVLEEGGFDEQNFDLDSVLNEMGISKD